MKRLFGSLLLVCLLTSSVFGQSVIRHIKAVDPATGAPKTGLQPADITARILSPGLVTLTVESVTTLGTYQAPSTATAIRFREVSASPPLSGIYEVHFHNSQVSGAGKRVSLFMSAPIGTFDRCDVEYQPLVVLANASHGGTSAVLTLERVSVVATTANLPAIKLKGNGSAAGLDSEGGVTGAGARLRGGSSGGDGASFEGVAGNSSGINAFGVNDGHGIKGTGGVAGSGYRAVGGTNGDAFSLQGRGVGAGMTMLGGTIDGPGFMANGGGAGPGVQIVGGTMPGGTGVEIKTTDASGVFIHPSGTGRHGVLITPQGDGICHGIRTVGGSSGGNGLRMESVGTFWPAASATASGANGVGTEIRGGDDGIGLRVFTKNNGGFSFQSDGILKIVGQTQLIGGISTP